MGPELVGDPSPLRLGVVLSEGSTSPCAAGEAQLHEPDTVPWAVDRPGPRRKNAETPPLANDAEGHDPQANFGDACLLRLACEL